MAWKFVIMCLFSFCDNLFVFVNLFCDRLNCYSGLILWITIIMMLSLRWLILIVFFIFSFNLISVGLMLLRNYQVSCTGFLANLYYFAVKLDNLLFTLLLCFIVNRFCANYFTFKLLYIFSCRFHNRCLSYFLCIFAFVL
jgi:hypothetical protein